MVSDFLDPLASAPMASAGSFSDDDNATTVAGAALQNPFASRRPAVPVIVGSVQHTNIQLHVREVLDLHVSNYSSWRIMFMNAFRKFGVCDHIDGSVNAHDADDEWVQIDQYIVSWLYTTVSKEIFDLVLEPDDTAASLWNSIGSLFLDNNMQRAVYAKQEFHSLFQGDLTILEYSTRLKTLADTLRDVGYPVSDKELLVNLLRGLGKPFANAVANLTLPTAAPLSFLQARSYLIQEERRIKHTAKLEASSAMLAGHSPSSSFVPAKEKDNGSDRGQSTRRRRGGGQQQPQGDGRNRSSGRNGGAPRNSTPTGAPAPPWSGYVHAWQMPFRTPGTGILGACPGAPQGLAAFLAPGAAPVPASPFGAPTPLPAPPAGTAWVNPQLYEALLNTPPPSQYPGGGDWYFDTGASSHMASNPGLPNQDSGAPL
ncbi:uncharacterized protein LOC104582265 [Brachypodium distachyon]|uniref:uncharacterized protein LOC104582265 n=1 Tax=Brachypodium distachyon TaxID=15368 RepID=UPI000D0DE2C8|nr:uncharacterized protein LOC104582265 [Brachypodium distachyon]|eukprot:XP_024318094.1 uncharacterized protein LOC104582265 [Brachypodium distachyon]